MKSYFTMGICLLMVLTSLVVVTADPFQPEAANYWGFSSTSKEYGCGTTFTTDVWVDVNKQIDCASVENMTFSPAGILEYTSTAQGTLFAPSGGPYTIYWEPEQSYGTINNIVGYATPLTGANTTAINNTNSTLGRITWTAVGCGMVTLTITEGGTALAGNDIPVTNYTYSLWILPEEPQGLTATKINSTKITVNWTAGVGDDYIMVRFDNATNSYPTSITDGLLLVNLSKTVGTSWSLISLSANTTWYFSAWGYNTTNGNWTLTYATAVETTNSATINAPSDTEPADGETEVDPEIGLLRACVSDPDGDTLTVRFYWSDGTLIGTDTAASGQWAEISIPDLIGEAGYAWYVNITDGYGIYLKTGNYTFTTAEEGGGGGGGGGHPPAGYNVHVSIVSDNEPVDAIITINEGASLTDIGDLIKTLSTGEDGICDFNLPDGTYIITVTAPGMKTYTALLTIAGETTKVVILQKTTDELPIFIIIIIVFIIILLLLYYKRKKKPWYLQ